MPSSCSHWRVILIGSDGVSALRRNVGPLVLPIRFQGQVDEDWPALPVEGNGILVVALTYHVDRLDSGYLPHGPVPGNDLPLQVDDECCIGQEIDNVCQPPARLLQLVG